VTRRQLLRGAFSASIVAATMPGIARAQFAVECVNCSTIWNQLVSYGLQVKQAANEVAQLEQQIMSYVQLVKSGLTLPFAIFQTITADMRQVRGIIDAASMLTGNTGSILDRLTMAGAYANQAAMLPTQVVDQFQMWGQTIGNVGMQLGRAFHIQEAQETTYAAMQTAINAHSSSAVGQTQAIQAGNEYLSLLATQSQEMHATMITIGQEIATRDAVDADHKAMSAASIGTWTSPPLPTNGAAWSYQ
jgi:P-type conjugative transfer protein TrbJ